jgi:hypothetical protein
MGQPPSAVFQHLLIGQPVTWSYFVDKVVIGLKVGFQLSNQDNKNAAVAKKNPVPR